LARLRSSAALDRVLALIEGPSPTGVGRMTGPADGGWLAPRVSAWLASPQQGLHADIERLAGPESAVAALGRLTPCIVTVLVTVATERICWAEVGRVADGENETALIGVTVDDSGALARVVCLRAPAVPTVPVAAGSSTPHARGVLEAYFDDLMHARFRDAAAHFGVNSIYSHPPYRAGAARVLFRGRDALSRGFETERGATPARQVITGFWQHLDRFFVEGVVEGVPNGGTFVSTGQIAPTGDVARYVAFYATQRIVPLDVIATEVI
jgi:hypothetical protein